MFEGLVTPPYQSGSAVRRGSWHHELGDKDPWFSIKEEAKARRADRIRGRDRRSWRDYSYRAGFLTEDLGDDCTVSDIALEEWWNLKEGIQAPRTLSDEELFSDWETGRRIIS